MCVEKLKKLLIYVCGLYTSMLFESRLSETDKSVTQPGAGLD